MKGENAMNSYLEPCKKFREYRIDTAIGLQNLEELEELVKEKPLSPLRSYDHKYRSNNWLKHHHQPMRRKPFKGNTVYMMLDEFHYIH